MNLRVVKNDKDAKQKTDYFFVYRTISKMYRVVSAYTPMADSSPMDDSVPWVFATNISGRVCVRNSRTDEKHYLHSAKIYGEQAGKVIILTQYQRKNLDCDEGQLVQVEEVNKVLPSIRSITFTVHRYDRKDKVKMTACSLIYVIRECMSNTWFRPGMQHPLAPATMKIGDNNWLVLTAGKIISEVNGTSGVIDGLTNINVESCDSGVALIGANPMPLGPMVKDIIFVEYGLGNLWKRVHGFASRMFAATVGGYMKLLGYSKVLNR